MVFSSGLLLAVIATLLLWCPLPGLADVGPLQMFKGGGVVAPEHPHETIRLDSQEVIIRLHKDSYTVNVVFNLFNTGDTTTEWVGFPKWVASRTGSYPTFIRFEGSVDGRQIEFDEKWDISQGHKLHWDLETEKVWRLVQEPMKEERQWLVSQITFPGNARTTICAKYKASYHGKGYREASYIYGTGSLWNGNIGKAIFIVDSTLVGGTGKISIYFERGSESSPIPDHVQSSPRPIRNTFVRYEIKDFKPHPEEYFRIQINERLGIMGKIKNYIRSKDGFPVTASPPNQPANRQELDHPRKLPETSETNERNL